MRVMGQASFAASAGHVRAHSVYVQRDAVGEVHYSEFKQWEPRDIVGAEGYCSRPRPGAVGEVDEIAADQVAAAVAGQVARVERYRDPLRQPMST